VSVTVKTKREIYEAAAPATLLIVLQGKEGPESIGSGVVIGQSGLVVTNDHVIEDAIGDPTRIQCFLFPNVAQSADNLLAFLKKHQSEAIHCKVLHRAPDDDIAFLQLDPRPSPYRYIALGDSSVVFPGDDVICIGNPHGLVWTMTNGSVSAHREKAIQISAPLSAGNSGGPLLNMNGELVGVNSFVHATGQNLNFARPSNLVRRLLESPDAEQKTWAPVTLSRLPAGVTGSCRRISVGQTTRHVLALEVAPSFAAGSCLVEGATVALVVDASFRTYAPWWRSGQLTNALSKLVTQLVADGAAGVHLYLAGTRKSPMESVGLLKTKNDVSAVAARFSDAAAARSAMGMDRNALPAVMEIDRTLGKPGANLQIALFGAGHFADHDALHDWFKKEAARRNSFDEPYVLGLDAISIEVSHVDKRVGDPMASGATPLFGVFSESTVETPDAAFETMVQTFRRSLLCVGSEGEVVVEGSGAASVRVGDAHSGRFRNGLRFDGYAVVPQSLELGIEGLAGPVRVGVSFVDLGGSRRKIEVAW
jgi:S1-C subfamily serine protease